MPKKAAGRPAQSEREGTGGPKKAAAKPRRAAKPKAAKAAAGGGQLRVKQVRSGIGHAKTYRRTLVALGLRHHQAEITVSDNPTIRGMLAKVHHLVRVRPVEA